MLLRTRRFKLNCPEPALFQTGRICFIGRQGNTLVHPIGMASDGETVWLLDGGRVIAVDILSAQTPLPEVLLRPWDMIAGEPVQEPIDIALIPGGLLVLDRVGDVYRYDFESKSWARDRYARPITETSSHYYIALATNQIDRYLLETSYRYGLRYRPDQSDETGWPLSEEMVFVDLAIGEPLAAGEAVAYLLQRPLDQANAQIVRYVQGQVDRQFRLDFDITQPRELKVGPTALYLLDRDGYRLTVLNSQNGTVLSQTDFLFPITTFALYLDQFGSSQLIYAGRNAVYLPREPERQTVLDTAETDLILPAPQPHNVTKWRNLPDLVLPIPNLPVDRRELRLPGAPRHYRQGIHQGMDFYWGPGREVLATAPGTVIRANHDYIVPTAEAFIYWRSNTAELGYTSPEALDFFRGRQVWIEHENGFISRYAHLGEIDPAVVEGVEVIQGQRIGAVGNSGSPGSLEGIEVDSHLHYELWLGDHFLGQYLRPIETRELVEGLFLNGN